MSAYGHGRHEHGQNFLTNHKIINSIIDLVKQTSGPIIEIGPGSGALTHPMAHLGRAITAVEVDAKLAAKITQETSSAAVEVVHDDFLNFRLPATPCVIVGNIPFHLTTAILRKLLHAPAWTDAVLLMQWEVARRRAGVGASTMMTAQWSPWFTFHLGSRVPRTAFRPQPNVDGGILVIRRVGAAQSLSGDGAHRFHCPGTRDRGNSPKGRVVFITFRNTIMVALARNRPRDPTSQIAHQRLDRSLPGDWFLSTSPSTHFTIGK